MYFQGFHIQYLTLLYKLPLGCGVNNVHNKVQGCTVDVQASTVFSQSVNLVVGVQTFHLDYYTSCGVNNVHKKFQGCIDVQAATVFLTIST